MTDFDRDPAALAWARTKVQPYINQLAAFEQQVAAQGDEASVRCFQAMRNHVGRYFFGNGGCVIGAFDERQAATLDAWDRGPSVAECRQDDRAWPLQREGE